MEPRVFLLSPASCRGRRAEALLAGRSGSAVGEAIGSPEGAPLDEVFTFLSGLYFRGKLAYAKAFARTRNGERGIWVITPTRGLVSPTIRVDAGVLREFARGSIDERAPSYRAPLLETARALNVSLGDGQAVLLGSIATDKYVEPLTAVLGERLHFPAEFVGRGDMSRGGLLLRSVRGGRELDYLQVQGAVRTGIRPPKLPPREGSATRTQR